VLKGVISYGDKEIVVTAGNSCPTNDGVSAALLMSEEKALALGLEPLARIRGHGRRRREAAGDGARPVVSSKKALKHAGIRAEEIDRVEFNEAFAAQVIPSLRELGISEDRVNVNGGSLAIGHPLAPPALAW
jgi:acetyl-CoA acetyltransferase